MDTNLNKIKDEDKIQINDNVQYKDNEEKQEQKIETNNYYNQENESPNKKTKKAKSKSHDIKNKNMSSAWVTVLLILLLAVVSISSYVPARDMMISNVDNTNKCFESYDFLATLASITRYFILSDLKAKDGYYSGYHSRYENLEGLKYYIKNNNNDKQVSNITDTTEKGLQQQIERSLFYLRVMIDEDGNPQIENSMSINFDKSEFLSSLFQWTNAELTNFDIMYIIPKNFYDYDDFFVQNIKLFNSIPHMLLVLIIVIVSSILVSIVAYSVKYSSQCRVSICRLFNAMFLELKLITWIGFGFICIGVTYLIEEGFLLKNISEIFNLGVTDIFHRANSYFFIIGIAVTFMLYLLIYLSIVYIKHIYYTGFMEGFVKNSLIGKICVYIIKKIKKFFKAIITIDITRDDHQKLLMILGINLVALCIIALTGPVGIILAIAYTIFLFRYLLKLISKVKSLNDASRQLVKGDFDISLDEDMGILSPISNNLTNIREGFKVAIDKAITSQKMKTELISNVSHDLKTPLTSIITYVDLLKNEDISEQTQKEYIDIIDRKSKRLNVLIEDLFEASKASSGNIELKLEKVDVIALLRQTLGELEEKINNSTLKFKTNLSENKVICELDGSRTYRVFENIMSNILKYSMSNSRVYIDTVESEKEVSFVFKNISAYEMNFDASEITERFTKGDKSRNTEGSGLGLAIAKSLIELQNGRLEISIDGDLFKLTVTFPKAENSNP